MPQDGESSSICGTARPGCRPLPSQRRRPARSTSAMSSGAREGSERRSCATCGLHRFSCWQPVRALMWGSPASASRSAQPSRSNNGCLGFAGAALHSVGSLLSGPDADGLFDRQHKNLTVADLVGAGTVLDGQHRSFDNGIVEHDLDLDLGQKVDHVFRAAIDFSVPLLPPEALDLADRHSGYADLVQRVLHFIELEGLDDRFDLFHLLTSHCHRRDYWTASPWSARSRPSRSTSASTRSPTVRSTSLSRISETMTS